MYKCLIPINGFNSRLTLVGILLEIVYYKLHIKTISKTGNYPDHGPSAVKFI